MNINDGLIPTRFLLLIAHVTVLVTALWGLEENVVSSIPFVYSSEDYKAKETELLVILSISIGFVVLELFGFLSGITMFSPLVCLTSILCHAGANIAMSYYIFDSWDSFGIWLVFGLCSVPPAILELSSVFIAVFLRRCF